MKTPQRRWLYGLTALVLLAAAVTQLGSRSSSADRLGARQLLISSSQVSATARYVLSYTVPNTNTIGSIRVLFCANDPLPQTTCVTPAGLSTAGASLSAQSGVSGFSLQTGSATNELVLTRNPTLITPGPVSFTFDGMVNPSATGAYFVRITTFSSNNASGSSINYGGIAFSVNDLIKIQATVPPFLIFCTGVTISGLNCASATGDYIDFGELSPGKTSNGTSQMLVATNARSGYNITVGGTTLTSGSNEISALSNNDVARPGTPQFGFNLRANAAPAGGREPFGPGSGTPQTAYNQPNSYRFVPGESVVSNILPVDLRQYTSDYIVNVPRTQAPGVYVATLTYVCLGSF